MRPKTLTTLLIVALALGFTTQAQSYAPTAMLRPTWPPNPKHMVNIYERGVPGHIPFLGTHVVFEVPDDSYFVVTGAWMPPVAQSLFWAEDKDGHLTRKGDRGLSELVTTPSSAGGPVGWVFRPGSKVVIESRQTSGSNSIPDHGLIGYLTPR